MMPHHFSLVMCYEISLVLKFCISRFEDGNLSFSQYMLMPPSVYEGLSSPLKLKYFTSTNNFHPRLSFILIILFIKLYLRRPFTIDYQHIASKMRYKISLMCYKISPFALQNQPVRYKIIFYKALFFFFLNMIYTLLFQTQLWILHRKNISKQRSGTCKAKTDY